MPPLSLVLDLSLRAAPDELVAGFKSRFPDLPIFTVGSQRQDPLHISAMPFDHGEAIRGLLKAAKSDYLLLVRAEHDVDILGGLPERFFTEARERGASIVFSAHEIQDPDGTIRAQPLIDYQEGAVRDDFNFGQVVLLDVRKARLHLEHPEFQLPSDYSAWYALRLALGLDTPLVRISESLYRVVLRKAGDSEREQFAYVDPRNRGYQKSLEESFTRFAKRAKFYRRPGVGIEAFEGTFPVEATVIIPVKNRVATVGDAVRSALSQKPAFPFNVLVVDNHSTDGTGGVLDGLSREDPRLFRLVPRRLDLGIGGCWNEAVRHPSCGRFCIQLDSDDLYIDDQVLQRVIDCFAATNAAAVVGSYKLVNEGLEELPPGIIDHREWSDENGHNNALRINGLGAPRAFFTPIVRRIGFPNVSYGEDYAVMLAVIRSYKLARIFEPLYLCRRWAGNSDASPSIEKVNGWNWYKDSLRTEEIRARRDLNEGGANA